MRLHYSKQGLDLQLARATFPIRAGHMIQVTAAGSPGTSDCHELPNRMRLGSQLMLF